MPLPWLMIFIFIFFCFYGVVFYTSLYSFCSYSSDLKVKSSAVVFPW